METIKKTIPFLLLFLFSLDSLSDLSMQWMAVVCLLPIASCVLFYLALHTKKILFIELSRILHWGYMAAFLDCLFITRHFWSGVLIHIMVNFPVSLTLIDSSILVIVCSVAVLIAQNKVARQLSDLNH